MAIKDKSAESAQGKGFEGGAQKPQQPSQGASEASALVAGVGNALSQQASAMGIMANQAQEEIEAIAAPLAQYFGSVADGTALIGAIARHMNQSGAAPVDLTAQVQVERPQLPAPRTGAMSDFFGKPKRISLPGS